MRVYASCVLHGGAARASYARAPGGVGSSRTEHFNSSVGRHVSPCTFCIHCSYTVGTAHPAGRNSTRVRRRPEQQQQQHTHTHTYSSTPISTAATPTPCLQRPWQRQTLRLLRCWPRRRWLRPAVSRLRVPCPPHSLLARSRAREMPLHK